MFEISIDGSMPARRKNEEDFANSCDHAAGFVIPRAADAHHGYAAFDTTQTVTLQGTVTDFHFTNPHCVVEFDAKDDKGQVQNWKGGADESRPFGSQGMDRDFDRTRR